MKKWTLALFVDVRCSRNFSKDGGHTPTEQLSGTLFQGKVTCKIGLGDNFLGLCVIFSLHIIIRTTFVPCIYIFKGKQIHYIIMSDLGPARSIVSLGTI